MTITLSGAISKFVEAKRAQRLSEHTLSDYSNTFRKFSEFVGENREISKIDVTCIEHFLANNGGVSKKTTLNYHTALSSLWTYLEKNGRVDHNIVRQVTPPRPEKKEVLPFSREEIIALLNATQNTKYSIRDRAIILLLLDTGMRASELCSVRMKDLNFNRGNVRVLGKGDKERYLPFYTSTQNALEDHFQFRGLQTFQHRNEFVFITHFGNQFNRDNVYSIIERISFRANVQRTHPHRFRHTFSIQFLRNGGSIYTLQSLLGHTTLDMVKRYLAIAQSDVESDHKKASPVKGWEL